MFVVAIALAILAPIVARLVQLAVSRQREYLADASGVELTRNPYGLERALAKITLDTGAARGRQPGDPAPLLRQPDQGGDRQVVGPVLDPSAGARPDQPPAGAHRASRRSRTSGPCSTRRPDGSPSRPLAPTALPPVLTARSAGVAVSRRLPLRSGARAILRRADGPPRGPGTGPR